MVAAWLDLTEDDKTTIYEILHSPRVHLSHFTPYQPSKDQAMAVFYS